MSATTPPTPPGAHPPGTATSPAAPGGAPRSPAVCVLALTPLLAIEIEPAGPTETSPEVHVHPGGQGLWLARMAYSLGAHVVVCGPFGGETGSVAAHLARTENLELRTVGTGGNGAFVHDRRSGQRTETVTMDPYPLNRHEVDDLYSTVLVSALDAAVTILTGSETAVGVPASFFRRLAHDLHASDRQVVADLSADQAQAVADAPGVVLKMSHEESSRAASATTSPRSRSCGPRAPWSTPARARSSCPARTTPRCSSRASTRTGSRRPASRPSTTAARATR